MAACRSQRWSTWSSGSRTQNPNACSSPTRLALPSLRDLDPAVPAARQVERPRRRHLERLPRGQRERLRRRPCRARHRPGPRMASRMPSRSSGCAAGVGQREPGVDALADLAVALVELDRAAERDQAGLGGRRRGAGDRRDAGGGDDACRRRGCRRARAMNDLTLATHCSVPSGQYLGAIASTEVETRAVVERAAEPLRDAGDGLVPGGEVAGRPRGAVEPVEGVVRALVAVLGVEELAEAGLGAGDGDEEDGVDPVLLPLAMKVAPVPVMGEACCARKASSWDGVGGRRGRRRERERAGQGGGQPARRAPPRGRRACALCCGPAPSPLLLSPRPHEDQV